MDLRHVNHNSLLRRIRRRIPLSSCWWVSALFCLSIWSVTVVSLVVWLRPDGEHTVVGTILRILWALTLLPKLLLGSIAWSLSRRGVIQRRSHYAFGIWPITASILSLAFLSLLLGWMDVSICLLYGSSLATALATLKSRLSLSVVFTAPLFVVIASAFLLRSTSITISGAITLGFVEAIAAMAKDYGALFAPAIARGLKGKHSRVEYGATALESCPIGGG